MARALTKLPVSVCLLSLQALHSLALPMTTWTPFDMKIDDTSAAAMPFPPESFLETYSSPAVAVTAAVEMPADEATPMPLVSTASFDSQEPSTAFDAISTIAHYIPESPLPNNILIVFQLMFGATAALCLILGLASCISRLEDCRLRRDRRTSLTSQTAQLSRLEIDVGEDLQILVVKTRSTSYRNAQTPTKSALFSPDRKGSLGKNVRWADEIAGSSSEQDRSKDLEDLLC